MPYADDTVQLDDVNLAITLPDGLSERIQAHIRRVDGTVTRPHPDVVAKVSESVVIDQVVERLATAFSDLPVEDVDAAVRMTHDRFRGSTVREFVPLLVERRSRAELSSKVSLLTWSS